jgi:uncharacterized alkaline shock family protein YloU
MTENPPAKGKTTIAPEVLVTIAQLATLEIEGVSQFSHIPNKVKRMLKHAHIREGVSVLITDDAVNVDLYLILKNEYNVHDVSKNVQHAVARAITEMVGMQVGQVNIHIEDIDFPTEPEA